jgi:hypothetical protein
MTARPTVTLYTDPVDHTHITATLDPSGFWILTAPDVFITDDMLAGLQDLFAAHGPAGHAEQALHEANVETES